MADDPEFPTCRIRPMNWRAGSRPSIRATSAMRWEPMRPASPSSRLPTVPETPRADVQLVRVGLAESAAGALESVDLFPEHERIPERQPLRGQCARCFPAGAGRQICEAVEPQVRRGRLDAWSRRRSLLAGSVANFQCRTADRYYGGDHVIFLGAVEAYSYNRNEALLFARGSGFLRPLSSARR